MLLSLGSLAKRSATAKASVAAAAYEDHDPRPHQKRILCAAERCSALSTLLPLSPATHFAMLYTQALYQCRRIPNERMKMGSCQRPCFDRDQMADTQNLHQ